MYSISPIWEPFYAELQPAKRMQLLKEILEQYPDENTDAVSLRRLLIQKRYGSDAPTGNESDRFLLSILDLIHLYETTSHFKWLAKKNTQKALAALGVYDSRFLQEDAKALLFWEITNALRRYFATCQGAGYHRRFFGLMNSSEDEQASYTLVCAWNMSEGLSRRLGLEAEMALFNAAVRRAYEDQDADAAHRFLEYDHRQRE